MKFLSKYFSINLAIDLGTANILIFREHKGIVINEPSVISLEGENVLNVGRAAKEILGKHADSIQTIRPLKDGVIADFTATELMIRTFIKNVNIRSVFMNKVICGIPTGCTSVERRAVLEAIEKTGAREVRLVAEPMAAAIGVGLNVLEPKASLIVDIGGGTTDLAVISYGGIVSDNTIRIAGDELTYSIINFFKTEYSFLVGENTADEIKAKYSSAIRLGRREKKFSVKGLDFVAGLPKTIKIGQNDIYRAINGILERIITEIKNLIETTPPELVADLVERGIYVTGGGAQIQNLEKRLQKSLNIPVHIAKNPLYCVVDGVQKILEKFDVYENVLMK
jgi:rod shape-determining protein MreB